MSPRTFLFLQGLASPFMYKLARRLRAEGHRALRINISGADLAFWPEPAINFRRPAVEWPAFVTRVMRDHGVTDVVLFGDCRPHHRAAIGAARTLDIATHIFEEGYIRPNWITLENWGTNGHSTIPCDPDGIRELAGGIAAPPAPVAVGGSFFKRALWDVAANLLGAALWPLFRHYRWHGTDHPFVEYAGWIGRFAHSWADRRHTRDVLARITRSGLPYYLAPLQLHSDYQIRVHSPFAHPIEAAEHTLVSFAHHAPADTHLIFKLHPLDNHLFDYPTRIGAIAVREGIADRVHFIDDCDLAALLKASRGIVVINSSIGTLALEHGCAVKALGTATYDMPGLTFQGPLDEFWTAGAAPDPTLHEAYRKVVLTLTQINGGFFDSRAIEIGTEQACARILARGGAARPAAIPARARGTARPIGPEIAHAMRPAHFRTRGE